ncbi:hypothetical protein CIRG_09909 [Coccidioides immitis RMSCC 2394]|uniref:Uncharacterized protein n=1 Tax=Coccidioides immitis RMSCC 2394 TaxID=404692 RepID=A0A0J6YTB4_COCIT|nr:hypothetical protein CIRG_09909 [Coccidioides immitis RMSCC 2394]
MAVESGITAPVTGMTTPDNNNSKDPSFFSSSLPVSDTENGRHPRAKRPCLASRRPSASILVPRDHPEIEIQEEEFPPDDARAMSPRRNPADVERLCREIQEAIQQQALLQALAERIDEIKSVNRQPHIQELVQKRGQTLWATPQEAQGEPSSMSSTRRSAVSWRAHASRPVPVNETVPPPPPCETLGDEILRRTDGIDGPWQEGNKLKQLGNFALLDILGGLEAFSLLVFTQGLQWSTDELQFFAEISDGAL